MSAINISLQESTLYNDFKDGNSVQVRVVVSPSDEKKYKKGTAVNVVHESDKAAAKIVSDPLIIDDKREDGSKLISLIVEKS